MTTRATEIRHVGIVVTNMKTSLEFYTRFLGFRLGNGTEESGPEMEQILGLRNVHLRTQKLLAETNGTRLELIELIEPNPLKREPLSPSNVGITHFALTVHDLESIYKEMRASAVRVISPPKMEATGFAKMMFCHDPDGNLIELIEVQRK